MLGNQQEEELPVKDIHKTDENNNHKRKRKAMDVKIFLQRTPKK